MDGSVRFMRLLNVFLCVLVVFLTVSSAAAQLNSKVENGLPSHSTFHGSDIDQVNLQNGNLHLSIPIFTVKQRGRPVEWKLIYDTEGWTVKFHANPDPPCEDIKCPIDDLGVYHVEPMGFGGLGITRSDTWSVSYIPVSQTCPHTGQPYNANINWVLHDPEGTEHSLPTIRKELSFCESSILKSPTFDGSGIIYDAQSNTITLKDGTQITDAAIRDTNGNYADRTSQTDDLGRQPLIITNGPSVSYTTPLGRTAQGAQYTTYTVRDSSGQQQVYRLDYQAIDYQTVACANSFPLLPCYETSGARVVPRRLTLPNNTAYVFTYTNNSPLELARIDLPTGASISYTYTSQLAYEPIPNGTGTLDDFAGRSRVTSRTVTVDGVSQTWTYDAFGKITDPLGNVEQHVFGGVSVNNHTSTSAYEKSVTYSDPDGHVLRTVTKDYTGETGPNNEPMNVRQIRETTTLDNGLVSKTETDYETFPCVPASACTTATRLNPLEKREYAYGSGAPGALLRRTAYTYLHTNNQPYIDRNIVNRTTSVTTYDGSGVQVAKTVYEYDVYTHANQPMLASGAVQHDSAFNTGFRYRGNQTAVSRWRNTDSALLTSTNQYDDAGNLLSTVDPKGNKTSYDYTDNWADTTCAPTGQAKAFVRTVTDAKGHFSQAVYNSCTGSVASATDSNGKTTTYAYGDPLDRVSNIHNPDGGETSYMYDDVAPFSITETKLISTDLSPMTHVTQFDGLGRVKQSQLTSDPDGTTYVDTTYDALGRKATVSNPYRSTSESSYGITTYAYDGLGRVTGVTQPDGSTVTTEYVGNTTTVKEEAGTKRKSQVDALGRLSSVWEDSAGLNYLTNYFYDTLGNLTCVEQHGSAVSGTGCSSSPSYDATSPWRVRRFTYNSLSQLLNSTNPESGMISYAYDNNGNVQSKTAPAPNQTGTARVTANYTYDVLNRLTAKSYVGMSTPGASYWYDGDTPSGCTPPTLNPGATNLIGRRSAMCDGAGAAAWSYDAMGRLIDETRATNGITKTVKYPAYYLDGQVHQVTYPGGNTLEYQVTPAGRALGVSDANTQYVTPNTAYTAFGAASQIIYGTPGAVNFGVYTYYYYNKRLQPVVNYAMYGASATKLFSYCYDFHVGGGGTFGDQNVSCTFADNTSGNNGNLHQVLNKLDNNRTQNFTYDSLNRVQQAWTTGPNWGETFTIDAWGNLTNKGPVAGKTNYENFNAAPATVNNRLTGYAYDAAGNTLTDPQNHAITYDAENRVSAVNGFTYLYDGDGERVGKVSGTSGTLYWGGSGTDALAESDLSGTIAAEYVFFGGRRIARIDRPSGTVHYYFSDQVNSARLIARVVDSSNVVVEQESDYYPYGGEMVIRGSDANHYKFSGKERDTETGLDNFGARYYASGMSRFMTPDWDVRPVTVPYATFGDPQTLNLYTYVENSPLNRIDPDGHQAAQPQRTDPTVQQNLNQDPPQNRQNTNATRPQGPTEAEVRAELTRLAQQYNVPVQVVLATARTESNFNVDAQNNNTNARGQVTSTDYGVMQVNSRNIGGTATGPDGRAFTITDSIRTDWRTNANAGVAILAQEYRAATRQQRNGTDQTLAQQTYSGYNAGPGGRTRFQQEGGHGGFADRRDRNFLENYRTESGARR